MLITFVKRFGWFWFLVLVQALVLNNIHFYGYATPFLYVYLILTLDAHTSRYSLLWWGFALGLTVDIFSNTPGVNAAATTLLAFARPTLLKLFTPRDNADDFTPGIHSMGTSSYVRYLTFALLVHQSALILLLTFSFAAPLTILLKTVSTTLSTGICILTIEAAKK